jgi:hypothetical protein
LILDRSLRRHPESPRMPNVQQPRRRWCQPSAIICPRVFARNKREAGRDFAHKNILAGSPAPTGGVLPATRRGWRRTRLCAKFRHKSRRINNRRVGPSPAISLPTAPAAEEVTK